MIIGKEGVLVKEPLWLRIVRYVSYMVLIIMKVMVVKYVFNKIGYPISLIETTGIVVGGSLLLVMVFTLWDKVLENKGVGLNYEMLYIGDTSLPLEERKKSSLYYETLDVHKKAGEEFKDIEYGRKLTKEELDYMVSKIKENRE